MANNPSTVSIDLAERSYAIQIGRGLLLSPDASWPALASSHTAVVVSQPVIAAHHGEALRQCLQSRHQRVLGVTLPDGEGAKTWDAVNTIITAMLEAACDRKTTLYALGGGVVGDVTGFAAACYMRGVPFVQVPTTLLAQVDSSVGGKTAINHALGKNMVGAFYQPQAVLCDLATLDTLPEREFRSGLAEVIKYGPIADAAFFDWLELNLDKLLARDDGALAYAIRRSCEIKAAIVGRDERETAERAWLNFGHTFGHAIEGAMGYGQWLHGEAVAAGMVVAARLSQSLGLIDPSVTARLTSLLQRAGLPTEPPAMDWAEWLRWMRVDKKVESSAIRYVVLLGMGQAALRAVDDERVKPVVLGSGAPKACRV